MPPLALKEAARELGYAHVKQVLKLIREGKLNAFRPGGDRGRYQIDPEEIQRWKAATSTSTKKK